MSVLQSKRSESPLSVITKSEDLVVYTLRVVGNEKNFPKRYRWCITNTIVQESKQILRTLTFANSLRIDSEDESRKRVMMQREALAHTFCLLTEINIAYKLFGIQESRIKCWVALIMEIQRLIKAWIKSDLARNDKNG